ncbi:MAG: hypothetical protein Q7W45_08625 [Bacteroidota bacterium]|nr:hypothetical protein [Bacteroidota bacterium]MDP3144258.1 hypothetical protein [Bacteroidota bacterium]MDP3558313.1 hypothetical protein [Bacteroidota bacterium]
MKIRLILFLLILSTFDFNAQTKNDSINYFNDFNFIIHLSKNKLFTEAEKETEKLFTKTGLPSLYKDSINYFLGIEYYNEKKFSEARKHFVAVSDQVFFYYKAHYLAGNIDAENNMTDSALVNYNAIDESSNEILNELKQFELSGLYLLNRNYKLFDSLSQNYNFKNPVIQEELQNLKKYSIVEKKIKRKSPFVAGTLSAIVPGLGKVYAGNNGQALASFLTCGLMGVVTVENYLRLGIKHPQTIFFGGVFSLFYIGNIWGSAVSVQLVKIEKQLENKHNILVSIKIPINKFFQ